MSERKSSSWVTTQPLLFNDVKTGKVFEIPAGEPCLPIESIEDARRRGLLSGGEDVWAAEVNLKHGYSLVFIRGMLRGVKPHLIGRYKSLDLPD